MEYSADYERIDWENYSSTRTPLNASNLNKMDATIKKHDEAILELFESGGGGTSDYAELENKPQINGQTLNAGNNEFPFLTEESDPTVPAWAKEPNKPTYTAEEVGALSSDTPIPEPTSVEINRLVSTGTHIADITVDGKKTELYAPTSGGGGGGTSDYNDLSNKPSINGIILSSGMHADDLGLQNKLIKGEGIILKDSGFDTTILADTLYEEPSSVVWTRENPYFGDYIGTVKFDNIVNFPKRIITRLVGSQDAITYKVSSKIGGSVYVGGIDFTLSNAITLIKQSNSGIVYNTIMFEFNEGNLTATVTLLDMNWSDRASQSSVDELTRLVGQANGIIEGVL